MQLVIRNGRLRTKSHSGDGLVDVLIDDGRFVAVEPAGADVGEVGQEIDVQGAMLSPPYVEPHVHMDTCLTAGEPRWNESGTLWEGIACWSERKAMLTHDDVVTRVNEVLRWQVANGVLHVRSHVDTTDPALVALDALIEVREHVRDVVNLQLVAFPQEGIVSFPDGEKLIAEVRPPGRGRDRGDSRTSRTPAKTGSARSRSPSRRLSTQACSWTCTATRSTTSSRALSRCSPPTPCVPACGAG